MLKKIFLVNRWRKKLSICGDCYFILTLLGVCHETVNFVLPLKRPDKERGHWQRHRGQEVASTLVGVGRLDGALVATGWCGRLAL